MNTEFNNEQSPKNKPYDEEVWLEETTSEDLEIACGVERDIEDANDRAYTSQFTIRPPTPPTKEGEYHDSIDTIEQQTYKGVFYADAMDMEAAMMEDIKWGKFREENSKSNDKILKDKIGDGNMEYIKNQNTRDMCTNAWQAISQTNLWEFISKPIDSFMWSNDPRIEIISEKMEELGYSGHSGCSFGCTMRNMQYLAQNGENKFKQLFIRKNDSDEVEEDSDIEAREKKLLEYMGGL
jgi:hypothetical protein